MGTPGTRIVIDGAGFDPAASYSILFGGVAVAAAKVTPTQIECVVPTGASSGPLILKHASESFSLQLPFTVSRRIPARFLPPAGLSAVGYDAGDLSGFKEIDDATGAFTAEAPVDSALMVWVFGSNDQPGFAAVATPGTTELIIDARSTAIALAFLIPGVGTRDAKRATDLVNAALPLAETTRLAERIAAASLANKNYLEEAGVEAAWGELALRLAQAIPGATSQPRPQSLRPQDLFHHGLTPDYSGLIPSTPIVLTPKLEPIPNDPERRAIFSLEPSSNSNVDWPMQLYALDPAQFHNGLGDVRRALPGDRLIKLDEQPLQVALVSPKLESKNLNVSGLIASEIAKKLFASTDAEFALNAFRIPSVPPGIYVSEAFSGNLWYGTRLVLPESGTLFPRNQATVIERIGGSERFYLALAGNLVAAAVDAAAVILPMESIISKPEGIHKLLRTVFNDVSKLASGYAGDRAMDLDTAYNLVRTAVTATIKGLIDLGVSHVEKGPGFLEKLGRFGAGAAKFTAGALNVFKKVSSGMQALERTSGLVLPSTVALERSIIVVGDPFNPAIDSFTPKQGKAGDWILLTGRHFPANPEDMKVSFCEFASTANPTASTTNLPASLIASTEDSLTIAVPTNARAVFPSGRAFICIETPKGKFSTTHLPVDAREFQFKEPPQLLNVANNPVPPGGIAHLRGLNFSTNGLRPNSILIDGQDLGFASVFSANATNLLVQLSRGIHVGSHAISLRTADGDTTTPVDLIVQAPGTTNPGADAGLRISVTRLDMSNAADGEISLLEGFLIANGALGRAIEVHQLCETADPPDSCPYVQREIDHIRGANPDTGAGGGPNSNDRIVLGLGVAPGQVVLAGKLPPPTSGDVYELPLILDGSGAEQGSGGWVLDGVSGVGLHGATLRNFPASGIYVRNGAKGNWVEDVRIENSGGTGVYLDGHAVQNRFSRLLITNSSSHGIRLSGELVMFNRFEGPISAGTPANIGVFHSQGRGVLIENGAFGNSIHPGSISSNQLGGVLILGQKTSFNLVGRQGRAFGIRSRVTANRGPGVEILGGASLNSLAFLTIAGNAGNGVLVSGTDTIGNHLDGIQTSFLEPATFGGKPVAMPNDGHGVRIANGARFTVLGTFDPGLNFPFNFFGPDKGFNVLIEGDNTAFTTLNSSHFGVTEAFGEWVKLPAERGALCVRDGSHDNHIGDPNEELANYFRAWKHAAIVLEGARNNFLIGNTISGDVSVPGLVGIHLRNQSSGNRIGEFALHFPIKREFDQVWYRYGNLIENVTDAGMLIEDSGASLFMDADLVSPNIVRGTDFHHNQTSLRFGPRAWGNIIGGSRLLDRNQFIEARLAEIHYANCPLTNSILRNRISNNYIGGLLFQFGGPPRLPYPPNPNLGAHLTEIVPSIGILVDAASTGQVIGESRFELNRFQFNAIGIYLDGGANTTVTGHEIVQNYRAGIVVRGGTRHLLNELRLNYNGSMRLGDAAMVLAGGGEHIVRSGKIGGDPKLRNQGPGLLVHNSSYNLIGDASNWNGNEITACATNGIVVTGPGSTGNLFANNYVGMTRTSIPTPNLGDGIRIEAGASGNFIGGYLDTTFGALSYPAPVGNFIQWNAGHGVAVAGANSTGNTIINNSISWNSGLGISLAANANAGMLPPLVAHYANQTLHGTVQDIATSPAGTRIQIFADADPLIPEGGFWIGEGFVLTGGAFRIPLLSVPVGFTLSYTATHPVHGSTSPFGTGTITLGDFQIKRPGAPSAASILPGANSVALLPLEPIAREADVRVRSITVKLNFPAATNGAPIPVRHLRLIRDSDRDGGYSPADFSLSKSFEFDTNHTATLFLTNSLVKADVPDRWLLLGDIATTAPTGSSFTLAIQAASNVDAVYSPTPGPAIPLPPFPLQSSLFTLGTGPVGPSFAIWKSTKFSLSQLGDPTISGDLADPDNDRLSNLVEYGFGTDPLSSDTDRTRAQIRTRISKLITSGNSREQSHLDLTFVRRKAPVDLEYQLEGSVDLIQWASATAETLSQLEPTADPHSASGEFELATYRTTLPLDDRSSLQREYYRLRIRLLP